MSDLRNLDIAFEKMTKSLEDIQLFLDIKYRMLCQAVSKYMIVSVCVIAGIVR
jgi:hypothetical protein